MATRRRGDRRAAPHDRRLCAPSELLPAQRRRPGLRGEPDQRAARRAAAEAQRQARAAFTIQEKGGTRKAVENGIARVKEMLPEANKVKREPVPASHLMLGLQCGGSDGYSGISANPGARRGGRPAGAPWRHRHPLGDARDLRRRAPAHAARGATRGRREADRAHPLVGGIHARATATR